MRGKPFKVCCQGVFLLIFLKFRIRLAVLVACTVLIGFHEPVWAQAGWEILFQDDFAAGAAQQWQLESGWSVEPDGDTNILSGEGHHFADISIGNDWSDYSFTADVKLISNSAHLNFRVGENGRYFVSFEPGAVFLRKGTPYNPSIDLTFIDQDHSLNTWYNVEIITEGGNIQVYVDDSLALAYTDSEPLSHGRISLETLGSSHVHFDNIQVFGSPPPESLPEYVWEKTGGPIGGLGYDVRIHPTNKSIMFVTDNPSGVNRSTDAGATWVQKNEGITSRSGASQDGIPIFSLTIDQNNPHIVWAGTQYDKGIYKSVDGGESWVKKVNGISEGNEISFRNFGIHPNNSNIVFAGAEIETGISGIEFTEVKGKIFRTADGGDTWDAVWECDSLVRFVLFDPENPDIMYASTGIFDREAFNKDGVGILKSTDGGFTWSPINDGIPAADGNLFVGFLEMHPSNPQILFAASGNNAKGNGGIYRTEDGGANWTQVLSGDIFTVVTISPSHPNVVYAGSAGAFYRSENGGDDWEKFNRAENVWGPPGVRAGVPISAVVDPEDPYTIFANNYGGGNFKSTDGAETWADASKGYTGAHLHDIDIDADNPRTVYTIGRSGPFRSYNGGDDWSGISFEPAVQPEWYAVALDPSNPLNVLISDEFTGKIYRSTDGGNTWTMVFDHPLTGHGGTADARHGFKDIAFASPPNSNVVYAGMSKGRRTIGGDFPPRASFGMYKSIDGGVTWNEINTGLPTALLNINCIAVHPNNPNIVYAGTWVDGIYKTIDGGLSWTAKNNGLTSTDIRSLAIDPNNPAVVYAGLGQGAGIAKTSNGGDLWGSVNGGLDLKCPSYLLPIGRTPQGVSLDPPPAKRRAYDSYSVPWTSIWAIAFDPTDSQTVYAGDHASGVYISRTGGADWAPINLNLSTKAITKMAISSDGKLLYAATEGGGVFSLQTRAPELTHINCSTPANESILFSAPAFTWTTDGGATNAFRVDLALSLSGPVFPMPIAYEPRWIMPSRLWNLIPSRSYVYWRVRGADLEVSPLHIIASDEIWWFYKP